MTHICILSDSHDNVPAVRKALSIVSAINPELLVHCGDITSPETLAEFGGFPMKAVFGNCDVEKKLLRRQAQAIGLETIEEEIVFAAGGKRFYVCHGTDQRYLQKLADSGKYDFILIGHTHEVRDERVGRTRIINPGALYRAPSYTIAHLQIETGVLRFLEVEKRE